MARAKAIFSSNETYIRLQRSSNEGPSFSSTKAYIYVSTAIDVTFNERRTSFHRRRGWENVIYTFSFRFIVFTNVVRPSFWWPPLWIVYIHRRRQNHMLKLPLDNLVNNNNKSIAKPPHQKKARIRSEKYRVQYLGSGRFYTFSRRRILRSKL